MEHGQWPIVMGRKNYLFSKVNEGTGDNVVLYSLFWKLRVRPCRSIRHAFGNFKPDSTEEAPVKLLPYKFK